nr:Arf1d [Vischeria sp. CAUP Q 202]
MGGMLGRLMDLLSKPVEKRVVLLGLDNAGKTTAVYRLLLGKKVDTVPTVGFNSEEIRMNRFSLIMWDIGGQSKIRKLWKHYLESADALIFVVDAQDRVRLKEARSAFKRMLKHKTLKDTVLLIYANKTDYEDSMTVPEIVEGLEVHEVIGDRKWYIQKTCAISGQGLKEGLEWLCRALSFKGGHHGASADEHGEKAQHMKRVPAKQ